MSEILNCSADLSSPERDERERCCGEREIRLEDARNVALNIICSCYCFSLSSTSSSLSFLLSLIDFIVLSFALRFPRPFYLLMVVVNCPRIHASSVRDGEFEKCSALVFFGTGRVVSVILEVKLASISANVCLSSTTGSDL